MSARRRFLAFGAPVLLSSLLALESCSSDDSSVAAASPDASISVLDASASPDASPDAADGAPDPCSAGGFCPSPLPIQRPLLAISGPSIDNVWAVGSDAVVRWTGSSWSVAYQTAEPQASDMLHGVWTTDGNDVWALGNRLIVRLSGSAYRELPIPQVYTDAIYAGGWLTPDSAALWVVTNAAGETPSQITRFHEAPPGSMVSESWEPTTGDGDAQTYSWTGIWGFAANDVFASGSANGKGVMAHYDGIAWSMMAYPTLVQFTSLRGTPPATTPQQLWVSSGSPSSEYLLFSVASDGSLGSPVHVPLPGVGTCKQGHDSASLHASNEGWVSTGCLVYRWDGTSLTEISMSVDRLPFGTVLDAWAGSSGDAWLVGRSIAADPDFPDRQIGFAVLRTNGGGP